MFVTFPSAAPEEDDIQVAAESCYQHAEPLPLPVCQPPAGMDGFPLQHALLYRFYGTGTKNIFKKSSKNVEMTLTFKSQVRQKNPAEIGGDRRVWCEIF